MTAKTQSSKGLQKDAGIGIPCVQQRLLPLRSAARYLGRSTWAMRELLWKGELPFIRSGVGGKFYIDIVDLDAFIEREKTTMV
jgi:excisionase family DNA binding protein